MAKPSNRRFVGTMLTQKGDRYVFGAEASPLDPDPDQFDCSELGQWAGDRIGAYPGVLDGAFNQYMQCKNAGRLIEVRQALSIMGAALFAGDLRGSGRAAVHHVAYSLGNGTTIEARGRAWGVGTWAIGNRFSAAGLFPGLDYNGNTPITVNGNVVGGPVSILPGSPKASIIFLQDMLNILRSKGGKFPISNDGVYGNQTKAAVSEFQRDYNDLAKKQVLKVTGGADAKTCKAIGDWVSLLF